MPHQNADSSRAAARNAAADPVAPRSEPRSYAAPDVADSSLAPPAAGEVADYMDEGEALAADDVQSGSNHRNRPGRTEAMSDQGPKTIAGNKERLRSGSADGR
ncbi:hypothetical protein [Brevundimonas sp.]|uniref:hypothetical protein n=1 Tax=Brevundimonas sp. TaxID=1871086 RepID=UPI002BC935B7|nr:hypothetical protein [Brevundimonas sp.]HWQ87728.1 hypothetical protein [Brevundimonas sp.]